MAMEGTTEKPVEVEAAASEEVPEEPHPDLHQGELVGTLATGEGWKYSGSIVGQYTKQGAGQQTWSDSAQYTGKYKDGKLSGAGGIFRWPTGETYNGDWVNNQMEGKGIFTFASGATYEGDFQCGKFHGKGKLILSGLPTETGEFVQEGDWSSGVFVPPEGEGGGKDKKKKKK